MPDGQERPVGKSLDDIAEMLAESTRKRMGLPNPKSDPDPGSDPSPNEVTDEVDDESAVATTDKHTRDEPADAANASGDTSDDEAGDSVSSGQDADQSGDDAGEAADEPDASLAEPQTDFEIDEDTLFEIDEDGTEVSFSDLKSVYQADKQSLELINTQKQATQEALAERARAVDDSQKARRAASAVFEHFDKIISTPLIREPDASLKSSNPEQYIAQLEAFQADQQRIRQQRQDLTTAFNHHTEAEKELINNRRAQEVARLADEVPALKNPTTKKEASQDILNAAEYFGFSPQEVNNAVDHRIYKMAYFAQQYLKILNKSKTEVGNVDEEKKKTLVKNQTRTLRSRGTTAKNRQSAKAVRVKAAKKVAQKSGKVDDVADFLVARSST